MTATARRSIVAQFARAQRVAAVLTALVAALAGATAGIVTAVARDDATSLAVARVVCDEMREHRGEDEASLARVVRDEVGEQQAFGREIEVHREHDVLGADGARHARLSVRTRVPGRCATERDDGRYWRVCSLDATDRARVVVGSPVEPLVRTLVAIVGSVTAAALLSMLGFAWAARRAARRALLPLVRLREAVGALDGADATTRLSAMAKGGWGADEIDELASTFDALLVRIESAVTRERRFLFDASHELRSPLTRMRTQLESALDDPAGSGNGLRRALIACESLVRMTESVLALARSELPAGEPVDVADVVRTRIAALDPAHSARVTLVADDEALVRASPELTALAVGNLVENALKFSRGDVRVEVRANGATVECRVTDGGPGIVEAEREAVFDPFFRGGSARSSTQGAGLGLALVRHVVTSYGGEVTLSTASSGGLLARIVLPAWQPGRTQR